MPGVLYPNEARSLPVTMCQRGDESYVVGKAWVAALRQLGVQHAPSVPSAHHDHAQHRVRCCIAVCLTVSLLWHVLPTPVRRCCYSCKPSVDVPSPRWHIVTGRDRASLGIQTPAICWGNGKEQTLLRTGLQSEQWDRHPGRSVISSAEVISVFEQGPCFRRTFLRLTILKPPLSTFIAFWHHYNREPTPVPQNC